MVSYVQGAKSFLLVRACCFLPSTALDPLGFAELNLSIQALGAASARLPLPSECPQVTWPMPCFELRAACNSDALIINLGAL